MSRPKLSKTWRRRASVEKSELFYVLSHYVKVGAEEIGQVFTGFQKYLCPLRKAARFLENEWHFRYLHPTFCKGV